MCKKTQPRKNVQIISFSSSEIAIWKILHILEKKRFDAGILIQGEVLYNKPRLNSDSRSTQYLHIVSHMIA